ncbi:MAG: AbrB/MazE/SpoVT family DNA-binding domain-containing protein [Flexilinea sp.]|nr:AbrB/MazE/SpoVT family DNA-binding domain-containing protein [Flexilinea sp.]
MEIAKVTSKGQITIPIDIRKRFGFQEGNKVLFVEDGNRVYLMNSTMNALKEAQKAFEGEAEKAGLYSEEDVIQMMKEFREERMAIK